MSCAIPKQNNRPERKERSAHHSVPSIPYPYQILVVIMEERLRGIICSSPMQSVHARCFAYVTLLLRIIDA